MAIAPRSPVDLLRDVAVLGDLPAADLRALADAADVRKAARGSPIFAEGTPAEGLYVVRTGEVKVTKSGRDSREQILYIAKPGKAIVEGLRFDGRAYPASAIAMRAATALLIPNETILALGERRPVVLKTMLDLRARRMDRTLTLVSDLSLRTVPARLASFLCALVAARAAKGEDPSTLVRDLTTETVAGRLGTVREEISRGLAYLEREGALKVSPDLIEVVDRERLEAVAYGQRKSS
jgi:CRP/FNR family transcriptional regulator